MRLFSTSGRMSRKHYFLHSVLSFFGFLFAIFLLVNSWAWFGGGTVPSVVSVALFFAVLLSGAIGEICATIRRLHDLDRSGSRVFLLAIPVYNIYLECVLLFKRGTVGPNTYGEDPTAEHAYQYEVSSL
jgi:uncharacterized membrane protein YhaH (DUF805 family)